MDRETASCKDCLRGHAADPDLACQLVHVVSKPVRTVTTKMMSHQPVEIVASALSLLASMLKSMSNRVTLGSEQVFISGSASGKSAILPGLQF